MLFLFYLFSLSQDGREPVSAYVYLFTYCLHRARACWREIEIKKEKIYPNFWGVKHGVIRYREMQEANHCKERSGKAMSKSKYETHVQPHLEKIAEWVSKGAEWKEIAKNLHIAQSSLGKYLKLGREGVEPYTELAECFARAIQEPNSNVEAALYNLCIGYTVDLQKTFKIKVVDYDPDTGKKIREREKLVTGIDQQHVPANVQAQQFYLANRMPDKWKYKPEAEKNDGDDEGTGVVTLPQVMENPGPPDTALEAVIADG